MARIFSQPDEQKSAFLKRIEEKESAKVQSVRERVDAETPKILHWALMPLATVMAKAKQRHDTKKGAHGEFAINLRLWARLPKVWAVINDVVLEYKPAEYAQIDHIAIGPGGIFLIETKAWAGAILLKNDQCFRKEANKWVKTHSPIHQQKTHQRRLYEWYEFHGLPQPSPPVESLVVFTHATWLVADQCSMPVLTPRQTLAHLLTQGSDGPLDENSVDRIVNKILTAASLPEAATHRMPTRRFSSSADAPIPPEHPTLSNVPQIREGTTRKGRKYVRIQGTREAAHKVWEQYGKPGKLEVDRFDNGIFFFYCD